MRRRLTLVALCLALIAACGDDGSSGTTLAPDAARGLEVFNGTCAVCHGADGAGISGLGKPLAGSEFVSARSDDELFGFLIVGRAADDPDNSTGIAMLPRGGNPNLTDSDLYDVIAYLRTLNP